jgi:micrococcal nuclease
VRRLLTILVAVVALAAVPSLRSAVGDAIGGDGGTADAGPERIARVVRVVDGDTIVVRLDGRDERVRYIGVDTPESVKPGTPVQCFAKAASAANERLVHGRRVRLAYDAERRDRYGRLLAYVYRAEDDAFVNARLVQDGYARTLTIPPNVRYADRFAALARGAREQQRGLWRAC